jgi:hypothetical protein
VCVFRFNFYLLFFLLTLCTIKQWLAYHWRGVRVPQFDKPCSTIFIQQSYQSTTDWLNALLISDESINCEFSTFSTARKTRASTVPLRHAGAKGVNYSSSSFSASELDGVSDQRHSPAAHYPRGKDPPYPLDRRLGGLQSWSGHRG